MPVNNALQKARKDRGYTLNDFLGYKSKVTYYNIENNEVKVTLEIASKIAKVLNTPVSKLFPNFFISEVQVTRISKRPTASANPTERQVEELENNTLLKHCRRF